MIVASEVVVFEVREKSCSIENYTALTLSSTFMKLHNEQLAIDTGSNCPLIVWYYDGSPVSQVNFFLELLALVSVMVLQLPFVGRGRV